MINILLGVFLGVLVSAVWYTRKVKKSDHLLRRSRVYIRDRVLLHDISKVIEK